MRVKSVLTLFLLTCFIVLSSYSAMAASEEYGKPKLYRLDCGTIEVLDLNIFSDTDQYVGQSKILTNSCYLINAGTNWLLWDTGFPSSLATEEGGQKSDYFVNTLAVTVEEQLDKIGLMPEDITHVGISHAHFDHIGNIAAFPNAKIIIQKAEYELLTKELKVAQDHHFNPLTFEFFKDKKNRDRVEPVTADYDFFGDGRVKAISLPGHTPGHMALKISLVNNGTVILSGDQWHFKENLVSNGVPIFNHSRVGTLASSDRLKHMAKNTNAKLILQHEPAHVGLLPVFPEFLD